MTLLVAIAHATIGMLMILRGDRAHAGDPEYAEQACWWNRAGFMVGWSALLVMALVLRLVAGPPPPSPPPAGGAA